MKLKRFIKPLLALLLFLCLADWPYGYYQFVRFVAMISFAYLAYDAKEKGKQQSFWIYVALALLFQPFFKVALGRTLWNIVDVVVGIGLIFSMLTNRENKKLENKNDREW